MHKVKPTRKIIFVQHVNQKMEKIDVYKCVSIYFVHDVQKILTIIEYFMQCDTTCGRRLFSSNCNT